MDQAVCVNGLGQLSARKINYWTAASISGRFAGAVNAINRSGRPAAITAGERSDDLSA